MKKASFSSFRGTVTDIRMAGSEENRCLLLYRIENEEGSLAEFLIAPDTYFLNQARYSFASSCARRWISAKSTLSEGTSSARKALPRTSQPVSRSNHSAARA